MTNDSHANELRCRAELIHQPGFLLAKGWQLAWNIVADHLADMNLTPQQIGVLHCLAHSANISQRDLAEALVIDGATMTGLVSRLEKLELIHRERAESDRRLVLLRLTPQGQDLLALFEERAKLVDATFRERLGEEGVVELCRLLRTFLGWDEPPPLDTPAHPARSEAESQIESRMEAH